VDHLFLFLLAVTGGVALLVIVLLVGFSFLYHRRREDETTPRIAGSLPLELFWTLAPVPIFVVMYVWGVRVYMHTVRPSADAYEVFVVGKQWMWKIQHPDGQREINELHIPVDRAVKLTLISEDVVHDFGMPEFRTKIDVLPGRYVSTWVHPSKTGRFRLVCNQYCGTAHASMVGVIDVSRPDEHEAWLRDHAEGSAALEGRKLFLKLQCLACHSADAAARAPVLEGLYGRNVHLRGGGTTTADENYIRESIVRPRAKVVEGWEPVMPTFQSQLSEEDLIHLVAYIRSLRPGDTPVPTNHFPAPVGAPTGPAKP